MYYDGGWEISNCDPDIISGNTIMDNFDMQEFFRHIGINSDVVKWSY